MTTGPTDRLRRELAVRGFEFLKAHDVGFGFAKAASRLLNRRLTSLILKLAIFIGHVGANEALLF
jgi:hypothetical protein